MIGPAIRKAIAHTLSAMMETINRGVEQSISWRAVQWRWTAFRTGKPFAEIVLLNTVQYRVEQVFLIHAETGLVLLQLSADAGGEEDPDQVSGMLTAIRDFVRDSFKAGGGQSLDDISIGDLKITIQQGPHAILACSVRGSLPLDVRVTFQDALESVHRQFSLELKAFRAMPNRSSARGRFSNLPGHACLASRAGEVMRERGCWRARCCCWRWCVGDAARAERRRWEPTSIAERRAGPGWSWACAP